MEQKEVRALLEQVSSGELDIDEAMLKLKEAPFEDLGFAKPDYHRALRQGIGEVQERRRSRFMILLHPWYSRDRKVF